MGRVNTTAAEPRRVDFHLAPKAFNSNMRENGSFRIQTIKSSSISGLNQDLKAKTEILESNSLDSELLSFRINFRRIGAGLQNLGNTCYLNSVLQCLTYTEPLAAYLQSGKHQNACRMAGFCALCAIQKHVSRALNSTGRILAPKDLVSNLRCISRSFRIARQEDAHEYMVNLLESMHKCCLPSGVPSESPSESPSAHERSLVHKIFGGQLRSQVKCLQCFYCSNKSDPFLDLSLEIAKADSLCKALAHFTAEEHLDGGAPQYQCQQCNQKVKALKQLTIYKPPHVLTVHLKRFDSYNPGQKINRRIAFGPTLDLKPFVTEPDEEDLKYTLYGVLVHTGWSTRSGHYFSFVRTSGGMWYSLDDNRVVQVNEERVLEQKAYMLFYVRDQKSHVPKMHADLGVKQNTVNFALEPKKLCQSGFTMRSTNAPLSQASAQGTQPNPRTSTEGFLKSSVLQKKAAGRKPHLIVKKKIWKRRMLKMHLSTNIICGTISSPRKRKKLRRSKSCNLLNKKQEHMEFEKIKESDPCPSTSESTKMLSCDVPKFKHRRKQIKDEVFGRKDVCQSSDLRKRTNEERFQLRTRKQQQRADHQSETGGPIWLNIKRKEANQPGLPRVLWETTVAKWDDEEAPATESTESERVGSVSIGYVGDERHKEYDRGKQKKLHLNKSNCGGPNLFQEIASKKPKRKRAIL